MKTGDGMAATGKSLGLGAVATTRILGCGKWYGGCPAGMPCGKAQVMVHITRQKLIVLRVKTDRH